MKMLSARSLRRVGIGTLALAAGLAQAHTGHGTTGVLAGLLHPFGLDHLLAMVAVGMWSVSTLPANKTWWGPATFLLSLVTSAALGAMGLTIPLLEHLISLSVVLFGVMLAFSRHKMPLALGLGLVALASTLHGLAHGAETPVTSFASYALGFLLTTAALHFGGVVAARGIRRHLSSMSNEIMTALGTLVGGAGLYLFSQV